MKNSSKIVINILIAVAISLVVNFSHLLLIFVDQDGQSTPQRPDGVRVEGQFLLSPDGHGYLLYNGTDSAYITRGRVDRYSIRDLDTLLVTVHYTPRDSTRHSEVQNILRRNGNVVAPYTTSSTPEKISDFVKQLIYYFVLSFVVILVSTTRRRRHTKYSTILWTLLAVACAIALYLFAPLNSPRHRGDIIFNFMLTNRSIFDFMIMLKWSFALVVSLLYSHIYMLLSQRQNMTIENERLRAESINAQYNMLMSQINPHVLFNSLNSLSMLVREKDEQRSLIYIDQLSYTFRYILQNRESTLTTLSEEMRFVEAYIYLFKIRYADKLFFDVEIDPKYNSYLIPALSLQPLLDNAVKHNTIVSSRPFHVSIKVEGGVLEVANHKYPKLEAEPSTGVGLENLSRRWELIAHHPIEVVQTPDHFRVKLPLIAPQK